MKNNLIYLKDLVKETYNFFKQGTKTMFKEFFSKDTNKKQRANMWTFVRLIIPIITLIMSIGAITISSPILFALTGIVAGFGAITDYFDGKSSRKHNSTSEYGKLLDQVSDKFFAGIVGINLTFINPAYLFVLLGELLIATVNVTYKIKYPDLDIKSTKAGKIKEWPLFLTLALGFLSPISPILLTISNFSIILTTMFQIATIHSYLDKNEKEVKKLKVNKEINKALEKTKENEEKELSLTKTKENTRLEKYKELRDVLNQIIEKKDIIEFENEIGVQKTKKL